MTEFYFPFASLNGDRETNDTHFARFYSNLFRDGVIAPVKGALKVSEDEVLGSRVLVDAGAILIDGRQYMLTEPRTVQIKPAESTGDRTDLVVVRLDLNARLIELRYLENATNPVRTEQIWDMVLARINVPRNATEIKNADITDMRANDAVCGYSTPYEEIKVSGLEQQYQSLLEQSFDSFEQHAQQNKQDLEQYLTDQQLLFDSWFSSVKNILDENVATNLLNMITQLQTDLGNIDAPSTQEFESLQSDFSAHQAESTTIKHKAKEIGLEDTANKFTAITVEGALEESINRANEAFQSASNGKTLISNAVTGVDDSVAIPPNPSFEDLAGVIGNLGGGIKSIQKGMHLKERMDKIASIAIETIDVSKSIVLFYARTIESHNVLNTVVDMYLANHSPGTLFGNFASRYNNTVERVVEVYWTVIEFEKAIVQRGVNTISDIGAYKRYSDIPIEPINLSRSMLLAEEISEGNSNNMSYLTKVSGANIVNESTIRFYQNSRIRWQVVEYE